MGKRAEQAKKRRRVNETTKPVLLPALPDVDGSFLLPEDVEITVSTLRHLCDHPELLGQKGFKELKRATYDLHRVMAEGSGLGASLTSKITSALQDSRYTDAVVFLFEMYTRRLPPKLGALQRWVRECDATTSHDERRNEDAMQCLDMILRIAGMEGKDGGVVRKKGVWKARERTDDEIDIWKLMTAGELRQGDIPTFRAVHHTPAHLRKPPNLYDSTVYASDPNAIIAGPSTRPSTRIDVPGVPGAFIILDVFTPDECLQIVRAADRVGFEKDEAVEGSARTKSSILAENVVWLADKPFLERFYETIKPFVPQHAPHSADGNGGGAVRGINARFRVYKYTENQVYRPHIDGSWPSAGLSDDGHYLHDSSPPDDPLWSRYTLLVYLNSDIPGDTGCTTFFMPSDKMGVMDATMVKPIQGAVLCFPHGDTSGSLLHEGSAVGAGGGKIVIRTDLLYEAKGYGVYKPA